MNPTVLFEIKRLLSGFDEQLAEACAYSSNINVSEDYQKIHDDVLAKYSRENKNLTKKVYFFGSRTFGMAEKNSDLDIFVDIGNHYNNLLSQQEAATFVAKSSNWFINDPDWALICRIKKAIVPILRVKLVETGMVCDISFTSGFACENSKYLGYLFGLQPEATKLAHFLKLWFGCSGLKMKSNLLVTMLVFYLQSRNFLPSTKEVQKLCEVKVIGHSNVAFNEERKLAEYPELIQMACYKSYILAFFQFYMKFPFEHQIASTYMGAAINKIDYQNLRDLLLYPGCSVLDPAHTKLSVIVLGPFDLSVNLARFGNTKLRKLRNFCKQSLPLLKDI